ncbi:MAG: EAL domain-containing protein [Deltaproteobacteria bacterium]|nr:EAL domain-containing protein [Deltaproteobacteria bacterium]
MVESVPPVSPAPAASAASAASPASAAAPESPESPESRGSVLAVDDDELILRGYMRLLSQTGYRVDTTTSATIAADLLKKKQYDVVISDIVMPDISGVEFLKLIREFDHDVPVILVTGNPTIETAVQAIEFRAFRYLLKPFRSEELRQAVAKAISLHRLARVRREATNYLKTGDLEAGSDRLSLETNFARALKSAFMAYQPIVCCSERTMIGYEALLRCREPAFPHPGVLLDAAERLGQTHLVGRCVRALVAQDFGARDTQVFVNLHPEDLVDDELYSASAPLSKMATRVILEVTERATIDSVRDIGRRVRELKDMGYRIALDDLGAGYAGLSSLARLEPDVAKIDMSIVRDVHIEPVKQKLIRTMVPLFKDLHMTVVVEGVETQAELGTLRDLGCDIMQGYLFSPPKTPPPTVDWSKI